MYVAPKANALTQNDASALDAVASDDASHAISNIHATLAENLEKVASHDAFDAHKPSIFSNITLPEFFRSGWDLKFTILCLLLLFGVNLLFYGMTRISTHNAAEISFSSNVQPLSQSSHDMLAVYPSSQVPDMKPLEMDNQRVIFFNDQDRTQLLRYLKRPAGGEAGTIETYVKPK